MAAIELEKIIFKINAKPDTYNLRLHHRCQIDVHPLVPVYCANRQPYGRIGVARLRVKDQAVLAEITIYSDHHYQKYDRFSATGRIVEQNRLGEVTKLLVTGVQIDQ